MKAARVVAWVAGGILLLHASSAMARPSDAERRCERTVAKASVKFLRTALSAPNDHAKAAATFRKAILDACPDAAVASIGFGGECTGASTGLELARCLVGSHEGRVAFLAGILGSDALGAAKDLRKCRATVAGAVKAISLQHLQQSHRCKVKPPAGLPPGAECSPYTVESIADKQVQLNERTNARIERQCTHQLVEAAAFGPPCSTSDPLGIANCVILHTRDAAQHLSFATHRDRGFCGDNADRVEARIDELLAEMTPEEKVSQMHGSTLNRGWRTAAIERLGVPGFGMLDGPRGVSAIAGGVGTSFPVGIARGATFDPALEEQVGVAIAREVRAKGASVLLAPTLNIVRHPRGGRTQESYGEDTMHLGEMGAAFVRGAQVFAIASVKHFAANSIENTRFMVDVQVDERGLREIYLPHFERVVAPGAAASSVVGFQQYADPLPIRTLDHAASVMTAYNSVNGSYCSENVQLLRDVLKGDWRFQGFVESDWIFGTHSTVPALEAGLDIEMPSGQFFGAPMLEALASGEASQEDVDAAVRRSLRAQLCFNLDTDPPVVDDTIPGNEDHAQLARQVAEKAIVLLKNDGPALPLARATTSSLVVVGTVANTPNVGDTGSSNVTPSHVVTPLAGITQAAGSATVTHIAGPPLDPADAAAIEAADAAIVVVGLTKDDEGEGQITHGDRDSLVLPRDQDALVAAVATLNPRTIVVLQGSGPVLMPWLNDVPAVLETWYLGQEGGTALGEILFGDVVPTGKLPLSFPAAESDLPPFDNESSSVTYDYWHGYRHLDRNGTAPLFPFGFGLTYTTFAFSNLVVTPAQVPAGGHVRVALDLTATGGTGGTDVVQLYVGYQGSAVQRAPRDLKAFARVQAQPGTSTTVVFDLPTANLAYWDVATNQWVIEPITYDVYVGDSSRDTPLVGSFTVTPF